MCRFETTGSPPTAPEQTNIHGGCVQKASTCVIDLIVVVVDVLVGVALLVSSREDLVIIVVAEQSNDHRRVGVFVSTQKG